MMPNLKAIQSCENLLSEKKMIVITETKQRDFSGLLNFLIRSQFQSHYVNGNQHWIWISVNLLFLKGEIE